MYRCNRMTATPDISDSSPRTEGPPERREILETRPNPQTGLDYLVAIDAEASSGRDIRLRYVPDKLLLRPDAFDTYLSALTSKDELPAEELALAIIEDINNEVVPRWVQVAIEDGGNGPDPKAAGYRVLIEDRQPNWDNPQIVARASDR